MPISAVSRLARSVTAFAGLSGIGLALAGICFAASLTPSLVPRSGIIQGVLAGASFASGYGAGVLLSTIWRLLGLPVAQPGARSGWAAAALMLTVTLIAWSLWQAPLWQDSLHRVMDLPPVETVRPFTIAGVALVTGALLILAGRLFCNMMLAIARRLSPVMPEPLALIIGFLIAALIVGLIGNDLLIGRALSAFDASYQQLDEALPADEAPPADPLRSGSTQSLVSWESIGAMGRRRVSDPLDAAAISAITGRPAQEPLRIYVGLGSAEAAADRAQIALREAIRVGAFERGTLVIATPTGTGWVDEAAMFPLETLTGGDVATISVQYSYLPSWLSLMAAPEYGSETARAVFAAIHDHWSSLPEASRPKLYLFGLSLGSLNSDLSADFYDLIGAPYQGALWAGPPFGSRSWRQITAGRLSDSPQWLPRFRDGSVVRFLNQFEMPDAGKTWGPMRLIYLQHASDPITFFSPSILWREPDWMRAPRGPDVSPDLRWLPLVTFLQVGFDVMTGTMTPRGFGHVYAGEDYMRGWEALLSPDTVDPGMTERLKAAMEQRGL